MLTRMEKSGGFRQKREALTEKTYNADGIGQRILNGDGESWIKEVYDGETIFQFGRFYIYQEIKRKPKEKKRRKRHSERRLQQRFADKRKSDSGKNPSLK